MSRTLKVKSKAEKLEMLFTKISGYQSTRTLKPARSIQFSINSFKSGSELDSLDELMLVKTKTVKQGKDLITEQLEKTREKVLKEKRQKIRRSLNLDGMGKIGKTPSKEMKNNIFGQLAGKKTQFGHLDHGASKKNREKLTKSDKNSKNFYSNDFFTPLPLQSPQSYKFFRQPKSSKHTVRLSKQCSEKKTTVQEGFKSDFSLTSTISPEKISQKYFKKVVKLKTNIELMFT